MTNPANEDQPKLPSGTFVPLVSLRKYWRYGVAAALVVACLGSIVAVSKRDKFTYSVMAKVRIAPRFSTVLTEQKEVDFDSMQKWRLFQDQQAIKVKQYDIVLEALKALNMGRASKRLPLVWLRPDEDLEVDETPLQEEVDRLSKQWKKSLRHEENKRGEAQAGQGGNSAQADEGQDESAETWELADSDEPKQQQAEPDDLKEAKRRLKEAQDKNEIRLRGAAERLADALMATAVKDSYLMNVSLEQTMKAKEKMPLDVIVNQVVQTYIDKSKRESFYSDKDARITTLTNRRQQLDRMINWRLAQRTAIAQQLGVTTFSENVVNPFDQLLLDSKSALAAAERELIAAKSAKSVFEDDQGRENREALEAASFTIVATDPTLNTLKGNINLRRTKLMEAGSGLEDSHPLKKNIDRELKEVDEELARGTLEVSKRVARTLLLQRKADVAKAQGVVEGIKSQIKDSQNKAKAFSEGYNKALGYNNEIKRYQNQLEKIENRKDELMIESQAPNMVKWESKALPPEPGKGGAKKFAIITVVASLAIGLIVPLLIDMTKRQVRTTNQVQNLLGFKPLAGLYETSEDLGRRMVMADIKRRLAIALESEHGLHGAHFFLFTSVKANAGVTDLAFDLALELGDLGIKALVVEVNALRPDSRYHVDPFQTGLIDLINGEGSIEEAISKATGPLPFRLNVGCPVRPHLYGFDKLREILATLKTLYDVVILDAPPVLLSADVQFLAAMADHTLLLIKARDVFPGELKRAATILEKAGPKAVSFIVTNLEVYQGGGYFAESEKEYNATQEKAKRIMRSGGKQKHDATPGMKPIFLYALHSGNLYGTERMALYTLDALRDAFTPVLLAPPGQALVEAEKMGMQVFHFNGTWKFARRIRHQLSDRRRIAFAATGVTHSLAFNFWNCFYRRRAVHLHLVHGGTDERESYGRKKWLNRLPVTFVAVSEYVRGRLIANGVNPAKIVVVGNFLPEGRIQGAPRRPPFAESGIRKVVVVSRVDPIKRIGLLLDALDRHSALGDLPIHVFGTGWDLEPLRARAQASHPHAVFEGFSAAVASELAACDLLLHLCPVEPFGLAILEAMAAGVPVLVPDQGGAAGLVEEGVSGFHFRADDADDLAAVLLRLRQTPATVLNGIVAAADSRLETHYSGATCQQNYRKLFSELLDA
jgi:succinoglycan biosynthesis transport protein ExoP